MIPIDTMVMTSEGEIGSVQGRIVDKQGNIISCLVSFLDAIDLTEVIELVAYKESDLTIVEEVYG